MQHGIRKTGALGCEFNLDELINKHNISTQELSTNARITI